MKGTQKGKVSCNEIDIFFFLRAGSGYRTQGFCPSPFLTTSLVADKTYKEGKLTKMLWKTIYIHKCLVS